MLTAQKAFHAQIIPSIWLTKGKFFNWKFSVFLRWIWVDGEEFINITTIPMTELLRKKYFVTFSAKRFEAYVQLFCFEVAAISSGVAKAMLSSHETLSLLNRVELSCNLRSFTTHSFGDAWNVAIGKVFNFRSLIPNEGISREKFLMISSDEV